MHGFDDEVDGPVLAFDGGGSSFCTSTGTCTGTVTPPRNMFSSDGGRCLSFACAEAEHTPAGSDSSLAIVVAALVDVAGRRGVSFVTSSLFEHEVAKTPETTSPAPRASRRVAAEGSLDLWVAASRSR